MSTLFKLTADVPEGKVVFGIFNNRAWVMVEDSSKNAVSSLDNPKRAVRLARRMLPDTECWPAFAVHLLDVLDSGSKYQVALFD